jgi:hypothetical protein
MRQRRHNIGAVIVSCLCACIANAQDATVLQYMPRKSLEAMLKKGLLNQLPTNLVFEYSENWGHQASLTSIQGVKLIEVKRNHGSWHRMKAICQDPARSMDVYVRHQKLIGSDRLAFLLHVFMPATVELEEQTWQNGIEVFSRRGRARIDLHAEFQLESKIEWDAPDRPRIADGRAIKLVNSKSYSENFVPENIRGVGGDFARIAGGNLANDFSRWQNRLENDAKDKLGVAIVKLGGTQETHTHMANLLEKCSVQAAQEAVLPVVLFQAATPQIVCVPSPVPNICLSSWIAVRYNTHEIAKAAAHVAAHAVSGSSHSSGHSKHTEPTPVHKK